MGKQDDEVVLVELSSDEEDPPEDHPSDALQTSTDPQTSTDQQTSTDKQSSADLKFDWHIDWNRALELYTRLRAVDLTRAQLLSFTCLVLAFICLMLIIWIDVLINPVFETTPAVCHKGKCLEESARSMLLTNQTVGPCEDFYQFACGRLEETGPVGGWNPVHSVFHSIMDRNYNEFLQVLQHKDWFDEIAAVNEVRLLYQTCISNYIEAGNTKELQQLTEDLGGWDLFDSSRGRSRNFKSFMVETAEKHVLGSFFRMTFFVKSNAIRLNRPAAQSRYDFYIRESDKTKANLARYQKLLIKVITKVQLESSITSFGSCGQRCKPEQIAGEIIEMERKVLLLWSKYRRNKRLVPIHQNRLHELAPAFPWADIFREIFGDAIGWLTGILVPSESFVTELNTILTESNTTSLSNYIMWDIARQYLPAMGAEYALLAQELNKITGRIRYVSRKHDCYSVVDTYMHVALRAIFMKIHIGLENLSAIQSFYKTINESMVSSLAWMTPSSKAVALQKLQNISVDYGVSGLILDDQKLNSYYGGLVMSRNNYFRNLRALDAFKAVEVKKHVRILNSDDITDNSPWFMGSLQSVHAWSSPRSSLLHIPPGGLQIPFFNPQLPGYINMAGMGFEVLIELNNIVFYDYNGRRPGKRWMDQTSANTLYDYRQCLTDNFRNSRIDVPQSMSDEQGVRQLGDGRYIVQLNVDMYMSWLINEHMAFLTAEQFLANTKPQDKLKLPGTQTTSAEQQFYLSVAQMHCEVVSPSYRYIHYAKLSHFPKDQLINNFVYNSPGFIEAFSCQSQVSNYGDVCSLNGDQYV